MTLATFAHRHAPLAVSVVHAVSPAVPAKATQRVRQTAAAEGWRLAVIDAGEFDDTRYRANPVDRCYFCKTNLYGRIRSLTDERLASGTNLDDLDDFRPGLSAAAEHDVGHPFVEARMDKAAIRRLARSLGLDEIAALPAQPCLASRVETGIAIYAEDLALVERVETELAAIAPKGATLRCRITHAGVTVEIGSEAAGLTTLLGDAAGAICAEQGRSFVGVRPYRRGAMFVRS
jgi:pyridinium-3,5-biscarboxylic acid mononucleotide sulfurtransferase